MSTIPTASATGSLWPKTSRKPPRFWLAVVGLMLNLAGSSFAQESLPPAPAIGTPQPQHPPTTARLLADRSITSLQASIASPSPDTPENVAQEAFATLGVSPQPLGIQRNWQLEPYAWEASAVRHLPAYFEEPNLERLGYYYGCPQDGPLACALYGDDPRPQFLQPMVSAAHFYGRVAALPYMMGAQPPCEEVYGLGEDRPGSPVPYRKYYMPLSLRGMLYQTSAVLGTAYMLP